MSIKYLDMYSGIGGFCSALEARGGVEGGGVCEKEKKGKQTYGKPFETKGGGNF